MLLTRQSSSCNALVPWATHGHPALISNSIMDPSVEYLADMISILQPQRLSYTVAAPVQNPEFYERARASLDFAQPSYPSVAPCPIPWTRPLKLTQTRPLPLLIAAAANQRHLDLSSLELIEVPEGRPSGTSINSCRALIPWKPWGRHLFIPHSVGYETVEYLRSLSPIAPAVDQRCSASPGFVLLPPIVSSVALVPRTAHTPSRRTLVLRSVIDATEQHVACRVSSLLQRLSYDTTVYSLARIPEPYERDPYWLAVRLQQPRPLPPVLASIAKQRYVYTFHSNLLHIIYATM